MRNLSNFVSVLAEGGDLSGKVQPVLEQFFEIGKIVFPVVMGIGAILIIIRLVLLGVKLAQTGDDPELRSKTIKGMIWWGIGLLVMIVGTIVPPVLFDVLSTS